APIVGVAEPRPRVAVGAIRLLLQLLEPADVIRRDGQEAAGAREIHAALAIGDLGIRARAKEFVGVGPELDEAILAVLRGEAEELLEPQHPRRVARREGLAET